MWNVATKNGETLLVNWVDKMTAQYWLAYYRNKYKPGKRYPNGKGCYPDFGFHLVTIH